jgi:hypothetical protein
LNGIRITTGLIARIEGRILGAHGPLRAAVATVMILTM